MSYDPFERFPGGISPNDGTLAFYSRINRLLRPDMTVVDLGAGRGAWFEDDRVSERKAVRSLRGKVARVIAADVDPVVHENRSVDESLLIRDGRIPMEDGSVDLVVCDYVLEHISDFAFFASEVDRVLKPRGWVCARTPHKYNLVSIAARLVPNWRHASLLTKVQPTRKQADVFPTAYKANTLRAVRGAFPGYEDSSFIFRGDTAYFFGRKWIYRAASWLSRVLPATLNGNIFVFLRKPPSAADEPGNDRRQ